MKNIYKVNEEAVKKIAERVYDNGSTVINRNDLEEMFPELKKESEDERIRKAIKLMYSFLPNKPKYIGDVSVEDMFAWLEKQGEHANFRNRIQIGDKVTRNEDGVLVNLSQLNRVAKKDENQEYQKPAEWTAEDERLRTSCIKHIEEELERIRNDKYGHSEIISDLKESCRERINWLKSLKDRFTWKPSKKEMEALLWCVAHLGGADHRVLGELYEHLEKLRGE